MRLTNDIEFELLLKKFRANKKFVRNNYITYNTVYLVIMNQILFKVITRTNKICIKTKYKNIALFDKTITK